MHKGNCKCPHHWVVKILTVLVWLAGVLFFWSGLKGILTWGYDPLFYAWSVVVLSFMTFGMKHCGCCGMGMMTASSGGDKMCSHEEGCRCDDCDRCR